MGSNYFSMRKLPNTLWNQNNQGDTLLGTLNTLYASYGLDLTSSLGKTKLNRMLYTTVDTVNTDLNGAAVGFKWYASKLWTATGASGSGQVHSNNGTPEDPFAAIGTTLKPATCDAEYSDIEVFFNTLYVTSKDKKLWRTADGSTWTSANVGDDNVTHMLCVYADRMYISNGINIYSINEANTLASPTAQYTFSIPNTYSIVWMRAVSDGIFIGTVNTKKGRALVYKWDGSSAQATRSYILEASGALACVVKDDIPHILDSNGKLLKFNGGGFVEIAKLPLRNRYLKNPISITNNRFIHPNGMALIDGRINMLINNELYENGTPIMEFLPSGIWEYDENIGLYHKLPLSLSRNTGSFLDWGQNRVSAVGGLAEMKIDSTASGYNGKLLAGATLFSNASSTTDVILINDTIGTTYQRAGYIVTPEMTPSEANVVSATWQKGYLSYLPLKTSTDKLVFKYRITKADPTEMTATITSTGTFTTTDANMANYAVGDEVEVIRGVNGGLCTHITAISLNAGTYTVTVDETMANEAATMTIRLQKWIKVGEVATDTVSSFKEFSIEKQNSWVQFKVWMKWTGDNALLALFEVDKPYKIAE